jgi:hypothetical protein
MDNGLWVDIPKGVAYGGWMSIWSFVVVYRQTQRKREGGKKKHPMYRRIVGRILGNPSVGTSESVTGK